MLPSVTADGRIVSPSTTERTLQTQRMPSVEPEPEPAPSVADLALVYVVLTHNQVVGHNSTEFTADGSEQTIALMHADALKAHAASVSVADKVLLYTQHVCEMKQRARVQVDFSLALVVMYLRDQYPSSSAGRGGAGVGQRRWCARALRSAPSIGARR